MRNSLSLIPAMALALAAQTAHAQQQDTAREGVPLERPGAIDPPAAQSRQELEVQDIQVQRDRGTGDGMERGMVGRPEMAPPRNAMQDGDPVPLPDVPEAVAEEVEEDGLDVRIPESVGQPPQQSQRAMERTRPDTTRDPVPLPDVPEAVAEELKEEGIDGVDIPSGVGEPPATGRRPAEAEPGQTGTVTVRTTDPGESGAVETSPEVGTASDGGGRSAPGLQAPPEPVDADREYYPGQPDWARSEDTEAAIGIGAIVGQEVREMGGDRLGDVADVLVDLEAGQTYAVVNLEDAGRQVLVPWSDLSTTTVEGEVVVSMPMADIAALPDFEGDVGVAD